MHSEILIPEYVPRGQVELDADDFVVHHKSASTSEVIIPASDVTAIRRFKAIGAQPEGGALIVVSAPCVWVRVNDDGEYIYVPDQSHARPMAKSLLHEQIDRLIADDVAILREFRRA